MYRIIGADGQQYGPVSAEQMRQWITEGRINAQTMAVAESDTQWKPAATFPEFAGLLSEAGASHTGAGQFQSQYAASKKTNGMAITGMIFGIASITVGLCCGGPLLAIIGIIFSIIGITQINKNPTAQTGKGMAIAGLIISITSLIVSIVFIFLFGLMGFLGELSNR